MKTKIFTLCFALVASVGTMFASTQIDDLYYNLDQKSKTAEVTYKIYSPQAGSYNGGWKISTANIPSSVTYNGVSYSVTSIGDNAFDNCTRLTSVTIPNSVTSIGDYAFRGCTGLTSIEIPNSVTSIGQDAFRECTGLPVENNLRYADTYLVGAVDQTLSTYTIKEGTKWLGSQAFSGCSGLTSITIPNSVTNIEYAAFSRCKGLNSIDIPNSVTSIEKYAFFECTGLTYVTIPNSITSIEERTFYGCTGLSSVTIPNSVTSLGQDAFIDCTGLTSVTIPNSVTSIGRGAFDGCSGLTSIEIPNSVTSIGIGVFADCTGLTSVTIPNSVTSLGWNAFYSCSSLKSVTIGSGVESIEYGAFYGCSGLTSVTCLAAAPPKMGVAQGGNLGVFANLDCSKILLYVPAKSIDAYKVADQWKEFTNILPISAKDTETTTVKAEPTTNSVEITWPVVAGAYTYEIVIKDKSGNVVCTLVFNAQGQLISIAFNAPGRDGAPQHKQEAGFSFVVNGLDSGTEYGFDVIAKDENGNVLDTKSGSFTTQAPQGLDDINAATKSQKIVRDGQIFILRGNQVYTVTGQEVK